jgi:hypothetical protein
LVAKHFFFVVVVIIWSFQPAEALSSLSRRIGQCHTIIVTRCEVSLAMLVISIIYGVYLWLAA